MGIKKIKVILCGFNWSGCKALMLLLKRIDVSDIYVYTHNSDYYIPSLKDLCIKYNIKSSFKKISKINLPFRPDLIVSVSYKYIIPEDVIKLSKYSGFNIHPSILPSYKGCSSITWSMIHNEKYLGFSYHLLDKRIDSGNILYQKKINLEKFDLQSTAYYRVMFESLKNFNKIIDKILTGFKGKKQKNNINIIYKRGAPYNRRIDDKWTIDKIERFIKAMIFPPLKPARYKNRNIFSINDYKKLKKKI